MRPDDGFRHLLVPYDAERDLLGTVVPYLRAGQAAGHAVVLLCRDRLNRSLARRLDAPVEWLDRESVFTRPAAAAAAYRHLAMRRLGDGARRVLVAGEAGFDGGQERGAVFEAIADVVLSALPVDALCLYDGGVPPGAVRTHPLVLTGDGAAPNPRYAGPAEVLREVAGLRGDLSVAGPPAHESGALYRIGDVADMRRRLRAWLATLPAPVAVRSDFVAAVGEVAANALRHGRPPVLLRVWVRPDRLVCTVVDQGHGFDDPLTGLPPHGDPWRPGGGLWLVRQVCDEFDTGRTEEGFVVRLAARSGPLDHSRLIQGARARAENASARAHRAQSRVDRLQRHLEAGGGAGKPGDR
ncbi:sensor histidine kinase [Actinomadura sp. ATCC 31491]|uniref:Sensor histidine kinase n=1 Tax=Actinomadura luzonensis TaxID=2805427 RepID=A0ABT0FUX3_9ACTN|nr:ATP-binding protein [Actinomadura luzonensis]MCK2215698.1 sensor histidine kinase [Actinomadura luzonensis]